MANLLTKAALGVALGATAVAATATPAEAQRYNRYRHHDSTGPAVVAGIAGLAIGAAIASSSDRGYRYDRRYYNNGYYNDGYYRDGYYRDRGYYNDGYYARRGYRGYNCRVRNVYDPYLHRRVRVRVC